MTRNGDGGERVVVVAAVAVCIVGGDDACADGDAVDVAADRQV